MGLGFGCGLGFGFGCGRGFGLGLGSGFGRGSGTGVGMAGSVGAAWLTIRTIPSGVCEMLVSKGPTPDGVTTDAAAGAARLTVMAAVKPMINARVRMV